VFHFWFTTVFVSSLGNFLCSLCGSCSLSLACVFRASPTLPLDGKTDVKLYYYLLFPFPRFRFHVDINQCIYQMEASGLVGGLTCG